MKKNNNEVSFMVKVDRKLKDQFAAAARLDGGKTIKHAIAEAMNAFINRRAKGGVA